MKMQGLIARLMLALSMVIAPAAFAAEGTDTTGGGTTFDLSAGGVVNSAAATAAGTSVTNDAQLDYQVATISQTAILASASGGAATFLVDRLIDVNVTRNGATKTATPGTTTALRYIVTNESNADVDLFLAVLGVNNDLDTLGTARANPAASVNTMCIDGDNDGACGGGTDVALGAGPVVNVDSTNITPGVPFNVTVIINVPATAVNGEWDTFILAAAVGDAGGGTGSRISNDDNGNVSPGGSASSSADLAGTVQDVFGDAAAATQGINFTGPSAVADAAQDGQHSAQDQFQVNAADMSIVKVSEVIYDPLNGLKYELLVSNDGVDQGTVTTGAADADALPKAIPGSIVRYTITVQNDADNNETAATAENVTITDNVPAETTVGNVEGVTGLSDCNADGPGVSGNGATCTVNITTLAADMDNVVVTQCDGTLDVVAAASLASGINIGSCTDGAGAGQSATIVYYVTVP